MSSSNSINAPRRAAAWRELTAHGERLRTQHTAHLFAGDARRFAHFSQRHKALLLDYSRQRIDHEALQALLALARACDLASGIEQFFNGAAINHTEARPALHMAMRDPALLQDDGEQQRWRGEQARMTAFAQAVREAQHRGASGEPFERIIALGIGGSELGPRLLCEALAADDAPDVRFVSSLERCALDQALAGAQAARTLFIVSSKSFTTLETMHNAEAARAWLAQAGLPWQPHLLAVTANEAAARAQGFAEEMIFAMPQWVGGRYSLWSNIALPACIALGSDVFADLLAGARDLDQHFRHTAFEHNLPVLSALIGLWNIHALHIPTLAVLPYAHGLRTLPAWLQQLDMESNGKCVDRHGQSLTQDTAPIVWGGVEPAGQHAFHQLLYQGTHTVALDFIVVAGAGDAAQQTLVQCALAQAAALTHGRSLQAAKDSLRAQNLPAAQIEQLAPHLVCAGNQPSSTLLLERLDGFGLGQLLAWYEHKVFVQGWLWNINSFDQFGIELGKALTQQLASATTDHDSATRGLLQAVNKMWQQ